MIDVPESYSFWDLHVAIQDTMGWLDYHLHSFSPEGSFGSSNAVIEIPDDLMDEDTVPGWEIPLKSHFRSPGDTFGYEYDFGDGWYHRVELIEVVTKEAGLKYPRCIDGARACPPEDCGGVPGYYELLEVLKNPAHEEHSGMVEWLKGHAKNYYPYDADAFDPEAVLFANPKKRFKTAFEED